jgi:hypothetical protein
MRSQGRDWYRDWWKERQDKEDGTRRFKGWGGGPRRTSSTTCSWTMTRRRWFSAPEMSLSRSTGPCICSRLH